MNWPFPVFSFILNEEPSLFQKSIHGRGPITIIVHNCIEVSQLVACISVSSKVCVCSTV